MQLRRHTIRSRFLQQYNEVQDSLANITKAIEKGIFTDDLLQRAEQLENEKTKLETRLHEPKAAGTTPMKMLHICTRWQEIKTKHRRISHIHPAVCKGDSCATI